MNHGAGESLLDQIWLVGLGGGVIVVVAALLRLSRRAPLVLGRSRRPARVEPRTPAGEDAAWQEAPAEAYEPPADVAARIADMRWRAARQVMHLLGAPRAPGLLRRFVEESKSPVAGVRALAGLLGCDLERARSGASRADRGERLSFLGKLDAFCTLEEEMHASDFPRAYRDQIASWLEDGNFARVQDLADAFALLHDARSSLDEAQKYDPPPNRGIESIVALDERLFAFAEELRAAPPPDPAVVRREALAFAHHGSRAFGIAEEINDVVLQRSAVSSRLDALVGADSQNASAEQRRALESAFDGLWLDVYKREQVLSAFPDAIARMGEIVADLAALAGEPPPRSSRLAAAQEVWRCFGFEELAPGETPDPFDCKRAYHDLVAKHHPSQFQAPEDKAAGQDRFDEIRRHWERARCLLGAPEDLVVGRRD